MTRAVPANKEIKYSTNFSFTPKHHFSSTAFKPLIEPHSSIFYCHIRSYMNQGRNTPHTSPSKCSKPGNIAFTPHNTLNTPAQNTTQKSPVFVFDSSPQEPSLGDSTSLFDSFSSAIAAAIGPAKMARENKGTHSDGVDPLTASQQSSQPTNTAPASSFESTNSQSSQPKFGTTSTLQNRLPAHKEKSSIFYIPKKGVPRPEHHRPTATSAQLPKPKTEFRLPSATLTQPPPAAKEFNMPGQYAPGSQNTTNSHTFKIPFTHSTVNFGGPPSKMAPLPTFSSLGDDSFHPITVKPSAPRQVHDLTQDDSSDDEYNPDAYIKESSIPLEYISPEAANENIKALLEGAFEGEDAETAEKRRLPRRKRVVAVAKGVGKSLADKLKLLEVKDDEPLKPENEEEDEDDGFVDGLKVKLLPHQIDGVAWMMDKECGEKVKGILPKGGILADDMGLGKTIQALSLILMNPRPTNEEIETERKAAQKRIPRIPLNTSSATLVVAPLALIRQWESEIQTKTDSLRVLVHHGSNRTQSAKKLESYDVVVTTYQTLTSESESSSINGPRVGCMGVNWYRIILDEAHSIKNKNAKMTKACYALKSNFRWCMTGTPMQNNLDELQSLIKFLDIKPYCDYNRWKAQITVPMKNGRGDLAMRRLQTVLMAFMKRRTKEILKKEGAFGPSANGDKPQFQIVERNIELLTVEFSKHERNFYDKLETRAQENLADVMNSEKNSYMAVLVLLLRLRQSCNHPRLMTAKTDKDFDMMMPLGSQAPRQPGVKEDDDIADLMGGLSMDSQKCDICRSSLTKQEIADGSDRCGDCDGDLKEELGVNHKKEGIKKSKKKKLSTKEQLKLRQARNKKLVVDSDDEDDAEWIVSQKNHSNTIEEGVHTGDEEEDGGGRWLGDEDSQTDVDSSEEEEDDDDDDSDDDNSVQQEVSLVEAADLFGSKLQPSTKILQLLNILKKETPSHKIIVFSEFTSMLDLIEPFLQQKGYRWSRYDGSMRNDAREASLKSLREDKKTRILLCSLKCGSLGLNLTAASRVVLMEPFWNPVSGSLTSFASYGN
jgi:SNF2 family DNA or RNA helicase